MIVIMTHGMILALGLILPIGMQNAFVLTQGTVHKRYFDFLPAVVAVSLCDTLLIALAVSGVSTIFFQMPWVRVTMAGVAVVFLIRMSYKTCLAAADKNHFDAGELWPIKKQITVALTVSLLNPHALVDTLGVIGGNAAFYHTWTERFVFGFSCAAVSWVWFVVLGIIGHLGSKGKHALHATKLINYISAAFMGLSAVYLLFLVSKVYWL